MRILAFYPYLPYPLDRGAHYRGFYLLRELAREHDIDLVALSDKATELRFRPIFEAFCTRVEIVPFEHPPWQRLLPDRLLNPLPSTVAHWTSPKVAKCLARMTATTHYDVVHLFDIVLAQFVLASRLRFPWVVDRTRVDLQYQLMERRRSGGFSLKSDLLCVENMLKLWRYEVRVAQAAQFQIVCGPDDAQFLRRYIRRAANVVVIPNGVDTTYFHPQATAQVSRATVPTVLFCGAMDYSPNIDALRWYFGEIHDSLLKRNPLLQVWIVGKDPVLEVRNYSAKANVIVTGAVPDVRPFYQRAWLQIVPIRIGGGTRLKIVESLAMGTPVVSTNVGAQGLSLVHDRDILFADSASAFVQETDRALAEGSLRARLASAGLATVRETLAWPMLGQQLVQTYRDRLAYTGTRCRHVASAARPAA